jgi:hypothetical protein
MPRLHARLPKNQARLTHSDRLPAMRPPATKSSAVVKKSSRTKGGFQVA